MQTILCVIFCSSMVCLVMLCYIDKVYQWHTKCSVVRGVHLCIFSLSNWIFASKEAEVPDLCGLQPMTK